jgi:hypothetical protein
MSTAVLSVASAGAGMGVLSWVLLAIALAAEFVLGIALVTRLVADRSSWLADARTPGSLTGVAATAVIGSRLASIGWEPAAWLCLAVGALLWSVLMPLVLRHWRVPTVGVSFLVCVATEGLAALLATVGGRAAVSAGLACFVLGLVLYAGVLARFDWRQLSVGAGDQWVVAGALAISSLAGAQLVLAGERLHLLTPLQAPLRIATLVIWAIALTGYVVLLGTELGWPRWAYDQRRWATVFPMGMTAAASIAVGAVEGLRSVTVVGEVLLWPGLAAWVLTAVASTRARRHGDRRTGTGSSGG